MIDFHSLKTQKGSVDQKEGCTRYLRKSSRFAWLEGLTSRSVFFKVSEPTLNMSAKFYFRVQQVNCASNLKGIKFVPGLQKGPSCKQIWANIQSRGREFPCNSRDPKFHYLCTTPTAPNDPNPNIHAPVVSSDTHRLLTLEFPNTISIFYYSWGHSRVSQQIREPE